MVEIGLIDKSFIFCGPSAGTGQTGMAPKHIKWYTGEDYRDITVLTDVCLGQVDTCYSRIKIAWIIEPRAIAPQLYETMENSQNYMKFDFVFTHDKRLLDINKDRFHFCPLAGHWIDDVDNKIHKKSKNISIIASGKKQTVGQKLRHSIIDDCKDQIDGLYGRGYKEVQKKIEGLKNYRFHIVIENDKKDFWFTEKLIDCFATGTVPIYCGCPSIGAFFNTEGILEFNTVEEFKEILKNTGEKLYNDMLPAIKQNFEISKNYFYPEDFMFNALIKDFV